MKSINWNTPSKTYRTYKISSRTEWLYQNTYVYAHMLMS